MEFEGAKSIFKNNIVDLLSRMPDQAMGSIIGNFLPIVMMHRFSQPDRNITGHETGHIRNCLEVFRKNGYSAISLYDFARSIKDDKPIPNKSVCFTMDDGFIDQYEVASSLFAEFDIPLTCFVITRFLDQELWPWDDQLAYIIDRASPGQHMLRYDDTELSIYLTSDSRSTELSRLRDHIKSVSNERLYENLEGIYESFGVKVPAEIPGNYLPMSWDNARSFTRAGHSIAPHTESHRILSRLSDDAAESEIKLSIEKVNREIDDAPPVFAYPTGRANDFSNREAKLLNENGVLACVSTIPGSVMTDIIEPGKMFKLPRYAMPDNVYDFLQYISWIEVAKDRLRNRK